MFELLQTVDKLSLSWSFGAQSQDALWWTDRKSDDFRFYQSGVFSRPTTSDDLLDWTGIFTVPVHEGVCSDITVSLVSPPGPFFLLFLIFFLLESSVLASAAF